MSSSWKSTLKKAASKAQDKASKLANEVSEKGITNVVSAAATDLKKNVKEDGVFNTVISAAKAAKHASKEFVADVSDSGWLAQALIALEKDDKLLFRDSLALDLSGSVYSWSLAHKLNEKVGYKIRSDGLNEREKSGMIGLVVRTPVITYNELNAFIPSAFLADESVNYCWPMTLKQLAQSAKKTACLKVFDEIEQVISSKLVVYQRKVDGVNLLLDVLHVGTDKDTTLLQVRESGLASSPICLISPLFLSPYVCNHDESFGVESSCDSFETTPSSSSSFYDIRGDVGCFSGCGFLCGRCKTLFAVNEERFKKEEKLCKMLFYQDQSACSKQQKHEKIKAQRVVNHNEAIENIPSSFDIDDKDKEKENLEITTEEVSAILSCERGVTLKWLIDFTTKHDCWEWSTQKVRDCIVWPATATERCRYTEYLQQLDSSSSGGGVSVVGPCDVFLCHAHSGRWGDIIEAAKSVCSLQTRLWVDIFAVRQWPGSQHDVVCFDHVIRNCKQGFLFVNSSSIRSLQDANLETVLSLYGSNQCQDRVVGNNNLHGCSNDEKDKVSLFRTWCLSELLQASQSHVPIMMLTGKRKRKPSTSSALYKANKVAHKVMGLDSLEYVKKKPSSEPQIPSNLHLEDYEWYNDKKLLVKLLFLLDIEQSKTRFHHDKDFLCKKDFGFTDCVPAASLKSDNDDCFRYEDFNACIRGLLLGSLGSLQHPSASVIGRAAFGDNQALQTMLTSFSSEDMHSALCAACFGGWSHLVQVLVSAGITTISIAHKNFTPLTAAAAGGHYHICEYLINVTAADVDGASGKEKATPLMYACQSGNAKLVEFLLLKGAKRDVGRLNSSFKSHIGECDAFFIAVQFGNLGVLKALVADQSDGGKALFLNCRNNNRGEYLLHCAAQCGRTAIVEYLIAVYLADGDQDISFLLDMKTEDSRGMTALMFAASKQDFDTAKALIEAGADVTLRNPFNFTALHFACVLSHSSIVSSQKQNHETAESTSGTPKVPIQAATVNASASENVRGEGVGLDISTPPLVPPISFQAASELDSCEEESFPPLPMETFIATAPAMEENLKAASRDYGSDNDKKRDLVELLVEAGSDMEAKHDSFGWTPIFWAAHCHNHSAMLTLIRKGCNVKHTCVLGSTPLMNSISNKYPQRVLCTTATILLDAGCEVNALDRCTRKTALHYANKMPYLTQLLLTRGGINVVNGKEFEKKFPDQRTSDEKLADLRLEYNAIQSASKIVDSISASKVDGVYERTLLPGGWPSLVNTLREMAHI